MRNIERKARLSSPSRAFVMVAEALGWVTLSTLAWGGFRFKLYGRQIALVDIGLLGAPWLVLLVVGIATGALSHLEDVPLLHKLHVLLDRAATRPALSLAILAGGYCALLVFRTFREYTVHHSGALDLGIFDQVLWSTIHGAPLRSSLKGDISILGDHFEPVLALISPIYLLWDDPRCLLLFQTLAIAAGIVPAYLLARRRFGAKPLSLIFAAAYLAYAPTRNLNSYHFHPVALVVPLFLLAAVWIEGRRIGLFLLALALSVTCQENVPLVISFWGLALILFQPRQPKLGLALVVIGMAAFLFLTMVVIPYFAGTERFGYLDRYQYLGSSVPEVLTTLVRRPWIVLERLVWPEQKIEYTFRVFAPFAFLSWSRGGWRWLLPIVPTWLQNTLSTRYHMASVGFQYTATITPFVLLGALDGARSLLEHVDAERQWWRTPRALGLAVAAGLVLAGGESPVFQGRTYPWDRRYERIEPHLAAIPQEASVSAQGGIYSHVAHRHHVYLFPDRLGTVDYIVLDRQGFLYATQPREEYDRLVATLPDKGYDPVLDQDGFLIYRRRDGASAR